MQNLNPRHVKVFVAIGSAVAALALGSKLAIADFTSSVTPTPGKPPASDTLRPLNADPEAGLSDSKRQALHAQQWSSFQQRYTAWLNNLHVDQLDMRSMPRHSLNVVVLPGQPSLPSAVAKADLIVIGTVSTIHPTMGGTDTTFTVDQTLKGTATSSVGFTQTALVAPTSDFTGTNILQGADGGLLLPGDRAVLFLQKSASGAYSIQSVTGWYQVVNGLVQPNGFNGWAPSIAGQTEGAFLQLIKAAAS